jgi:hypothetical protein
MGARATEQAQVANAYEKRRRVDAHSRMWDFSKGPSEKESSKRESAKGSALMFDATRAGRALMAVLGVASVVVLSSACAVELVELSPQGRVIYGDLVVHGIIRSFKPELVTMYEMSLNEGTPDAGYPITTLTVEVLEVIKGCWKERLLPAVAEGGVPDGVPNELGAITFINALGYPYTYNYAVEDEVILVMRYWKPLRGGSYIIVSDEGRYIKRGDVWENQGTKDTSISIEDVRSWATATQPREVYQEAEVVALGTVREVSIDTTTKRRAEIAWVTLELRRVWKGEIPGDTLRFGIVVRGGHSLAWRRPAPVVAIGEEWLCFLKTGPDGLYSFAGTNGLLKMKGESVLANDCVLCDVSKSELIETLSQESGGDE